MSLVKIASFSSLSFSQNNIFDLSSSINRDNCLQPFFTLKSKFLEYGVEINTSDLTKSSPILFDIEMDVQETVSISKPFENPTYLLMMENSLVWPSNASNQLLDKYRKIFTWDDRLVDGDRFIKIHYPNPITVNQFNVKKENFCCLISSNRTLDSNDNRILYGERVNVIQWFEKYAPNDFDLYGIDWDIPVMPKGIVGRLKRRFYKLLAKYISLNPFPSYKGKVSHKKDVLSNTKFAICYENVRDLDGYITEKIFDCFFSGCVPVYWGANNIFDYIPSDCFIDRRSFDSHEALYQFMVSMKEHEYIGYQERITAFLKSDQAKPFSAEVFAETIVKTIVNDLAISV